MNQLARKLIIGTLQGYKRVISPMFLPACRYVPTCSEYAIESVDRHGAVRGSLMGAWRLLRCHPFAKGGYDPVTSANLRKCGDARCCVSSTPIR